MSDYTSFVAVDEKILRPKNAVLLSQRYSPNLPKGWQLAEYDPREAAKDYERAMAEKKEAEEAGAEGNENLDLPQTDTGYALRILTGLLAMLLSLALLWSVRRYEAA